MHSVTESGRLYGSRMTRLALETSHFGAVWDAHLKGTSGGVELLEQFVVGVKFSGTDRLGAEGKVKKFRGKFFYLVCMFETFRSMVLVVVEGQTQDQGKGERTKEGGRDPNLRNRQVGKLRLLVDRGTYLKSV